MLRLKEGVRSVGIRPEIALAASVSASVFETFGHDCIITSLTDGTHSATSLHYAGSAMDLRIRHLPQGATQKIVDVLSEALGPDYDVVLESDHIHLEFQPRKLSCSKD